MQFKEWGAAREGHFLEGRVSGLFFLGGGRCSRLGMSRNEPFPKGSREEGNPLIYSLPFSFHENTGDPEVLPPLPPTLEGERVGFCFKCQERTTVLAATEVLARRRKDRKKGFLENSYPQETVDGGKRPSLTDG